jgi:hypothetical protein
MCLLKRFVSLQDLTDFKEKANTILFNSSKNELFKINENYKTLDRKLKGSWKILT